jgi:FkbM family methyltransferase
MLIDLRTLKAKHGMRITGVLHVGAHECEEAPVYAEVVEPGARILWVEGNPEICARLRAGGVPDVLEALVSDVDGAETDFFIMSNGQSSSLMEPAEHRREHPDVFEIARIRLRTVTLDSLLAGLPEKLFFNFLNLDIQGAELLALKGLGRDRLNSVDFVYTEVNVKELYVNCARLSDIDAFLGAAGFARTDLELTRHGWGDALYVRTDERTGEPGTSE